MNYFAHALPFLDRPYFMAGTAVPDWLTVVDRKVRLRLRHVKPFLDAADSPITEVAGGVLQHLADDAQFHQSRAFVETSLELTARASKALGAEQSLRPRFLGHLLLEVLLDASLVADNPGKMEEYYRVLGSLDPRLIERLINRMAPRPTDRLAAMISEFCLLRILSDYAEDGKLMWRLNQVMRRLGLDQLPDRFAEILPGARRLIDAKKNDLLTGLPTSPLQGERQCDTE